MQPGANRIDLKKLGELLAAQVLAAPPGPPTPEGAEDARQDLCLARGDAYDACREVAAQHGYRTHIPPKRSQEQPLPRPGIHPGGG